MAFAIIFESVGVGEWFVLLAVLLIVVGPKRLPATARKFGQYYSKFRRAADSFKRQLMDMDTEISRTVGDAGREVEKAADAAARSLDVSSESEAPRDYESYGDYPPEYPGMDGGSESEPQPAPEPAPPPEPAPKPDLTAVKISVSPAPRN